MKPREKLRRAPRAARQVAHDEHRPLVAYDLQCAPHGAAVTFTSSHLNGAVLSRSFAARPCVLRKTYVCARSESLAVGQKLNTGRAFVPQTIIRLQQDCIPVANRT